MQLLENWKERLRSRHTIALFRDKEDLAIRVAADLSRALKDFESGSASRNFLANDESDDLTADIQAATREAISAGVDSEVIRSALARTLSSLIRRSRKQKPSIFIGYSRSDINIVRVVVDKLKSEGFNPWVDIENVSPGQHIAKAINRAILGADASIFFLSPESTNSAWMNAEMEAAMVSQLELGIVAPRIIPVIVAGEDRDVSPLWRQFRWIDLRRRSYEVGMHDLIATLQQLGGDYSGGF